MSTIKPVAVRNVILVAGYDYEDPSRSFDAIALERIREIFDQEEHMRYPLRFHFFSAAQGIVAESLVFDKTFRNPKSLPIEKLDVGFAWQWVDRRYLPISAANYRNGKEFKELDEKQRGSKRVLSITDVYAYLYSFWEAANQSSPKNPVAFDSIFELNFFAHASPSGVSLVNSVDANSNSIRRDPNDKDARVKDVLGYSIDPERNNPTVAQFWSRLSTVFDRNAGRIRIWCSVLTPDTQYYAALIRAAMSARADTLQKTATSELKPKWTDTDPIAVTDPVVIDRLKGEAASLTLGQVKAILKQAQWSSYATALQAALSGSRYDPNKPPAEEVQGLFVSTYVPPLGTETAVERTRKTASKLHRLFAVSPKDQEIVRFHTEQLRLELDRGNRNFGIFGRTPAQNPAPVEQGQNGSPLAGLQLFMVYQPLLPIDSATGRVQQHEPLRAILMEKVRELEKKLGVKYPKDSGQVNLPAFAIAEVTPGKPVTYASTVNDEALFYSGSLLKVAALFAACRMRTVLLEFGNKPEFRNIPIKDVIDSLPGYLNGMIARSVDFSQAQILKRGSKAVFTWQHRVPRYNDIFGGTKTLGEINEHYEQNVRNIFNYTDDQHPETTGGTNQAAGKFIHAMGYAWINAVMRYSGFPGIWLAGDYSEEEKTLAGVKASYPAAKIPSVNDEEVAQCTTTRDMVAFYAFLSRNTMIPEAIIMHDKWLPLGSASSYIDIGPELSPDRWAVIGTKIGLGPLKKGSSVGSEASLITENKTNRNFVVVFQNCLDFEGRPNDQLEPVYTLLGAALAAYVPPP